MEKIKKAFRVAQDVIFLGVICIYIAICFFSPVAIPFALWWVWGRMRGIPSSTLFKTLRARICSAGNINPWHTHTSTTEPWQSAFVSV